MNTNNFSYIPKNLQQKMFAGQDRALKHIYLLSDVYNTSGLPNWDQVESTKNREFIFVNIYEYYVNSIKPELEAKIKNNPNFNNKTKLLAEAVFCEYYLFTLTSALFGVYFDGNSLIDDLCKCNNQQAQKILFRYCDMFTAGAIFGLLSANNDVKGGLEKQALRAKKLVLNIYNLPLSSSFSPTTTEEQLAVAREYDKRFFKGDDKLEGKECIMPSREIKHEICKNLGLKKHNQLLFVYDMTGGAKSDQAKYVVENPKHNTVYPEYWLNEFEKEMKRAKESENKHIFTRRK